MCPCRNTRPRRQAPAPPPPDDPAISKADEVIVNGSRLKPYRNVYTSADGMRVEAVRIADFRDTKLNTDCGPSLGSDGVSLLSSRDSLNSAVLRCRLHKAGGHRCGQRPAVRWCPMPPEWLLTRAPGTCPSAVSGMYRKPVLNPISPAVKFYMMQATTCVGSYLHRAVLLPVLCREHGAAGAADGLRGGQVQPGIGEPLSESRRKLTGLDTALPELNPSPRMRGSDTVLWLRPKRDSSRLAAAYASVVRTAAATRATAGTRRRLAAIVAHQNLNHLVSLGWGRWLALLCQLRRRPGRCGLTSGLGLSLAESRSGDVGRTAGGSATTVRAAVGAQDPFSAALRSPMERWALLLFDQQRMQQPVVLCGGLRRLGRRSLGRLSRNRGGLPAHRHGILIALRFLLPPGGLRCLCLLISFPACSLLGLRPCLRSCLCSLGGLPFLFVRLFLRSLSGLVDDIPDIRKGYAARDEMLGRSRVSWSQPSPQTISTRSKSRQSGPHASSLCC